MNENMLFHLGLTRGQGARYALMPGDPGRVESMARMLDSPAPVASHREFCTWSGTLHGERVLVTSTGIGGPSAAIALEELHRIGVDTVIRVGTCGGMQTDVLSGDLVIASAAVRMDGASAQYAPMSFPAVADFSVLSALHRAAQKLDARAHVGVVQAKDSFYGQHAPETMPVGQALMADWDAFLKLGVLASEMECATLYTVAAARRIRAGGVLLSVWNQERAKAGLPNPTVLDTKRASAAAVEALRILIREE